ncbi:DUF726-containing protein [Aureococcus anophagefferens]|nr:DUF726-containing protein [Aureococcus anophagefferens]
MSMENVNASSSDRWTTTEALKTLFLSLAPDAEGRVSGTKIRAWVATRYAEALDTASLVDSWDEADTTKRGSLDEAEFLVFAAALEAAAARRRQARGVVRGGPNAAGRRRQARRRAAVDAACGGWDAPAAVSVLALVASCLVDDGEDGAWNALILHAPLAALLRRGAAAAPAARALRAAPSLLVAPVVAGGGAYDARQRVALQKAAGFLGFEKGWLRARERGLATALTGEQPDDAETASTLATTAGPESNTDVALRYAKIGTAATAAGVVIGLTAEPRGACSLAFWRARRSATARPWPRDASAADAAPYVTFGDGGGAKRRESRVSKMVGKMYADQKGDDAEATAKGCCRPATAPGAAAAW